jgi:hypothetical protein
MKMYTKNLVQVAVLIFMLVSTAGCGISSSNETLYDSDSFESTESEPTPTAELNWAPKKFTQVDESIAYRFTTNKGSWPCQDCNFWKLTVIANQECTNGVYAELNMKDSSGTVVNWSNDSIPYLGAGQKAVLTFENYPYDSNLESGELTKLTCHTF